MLLKIINKRHKSTVQHTNVRHGTALSEPSQKQQNNNRKEKDGNAKKFESRRLRFPIEIRPITTRRV